jgi:hypothetical protein
MDAKTNEKREAFKKFYRTGLQIHNLTLSLHTFSQRRSHRLGVRTPDFHSGNTGSIPVGTT